MGKRRRRNKKKMATILNPTDVQRMDVIRKFAAAVSQLPPGAKKISFNCEPYKTDDKATVWFTPDAWAKMTALINFVGEKEVGWHGVVKRADDMEGHNYVVSDILVYPQDVASATVNTDQEAYQNWLNAFDDDVFNNIRGHFHSHVNFSPSPSTTDDTHVESLVNQLSGDMFYLFMIWNKKLEYTCRLYDLRENLLFEDKDVAVKTIDNIGLSRFLEDAKTKIKVRTCPNVQVYNGTNQNKSGSATGSTTHTSPTTTSGANTKLPMRRSPQIGGGWRGGDYEDEYENMNGPYCGS